MPPLTDTLLRSLKFGAKKRHFDGRGLYLEISHTGAKLWRMKYRFRGREKRISFGEYPSISLKQARVECEESRMLLRRGIDPSAHRRASRASTQNSFEAVTREWLAGQKPIWAESHYSRIESFFENDLFPYLGSYSVGEITAPQLLTAIRRIERRALERAHRALGSCGQVFRYAIATGRAERDPAADLRGALPPHKGKHFAAPTEPATLAPILKSLDQYSGTVVVQAALKLAPLVFVRPGELRKAKWEDFDLSAAEWRYLSSKTGRPHIVPLSRQAVAILEELWPVTGDGAYAFPSARSKKRPMSDNAVLAAMRRCDIPKDQLTGHGFRATARTILDEVLHFRPDIIDHQLAHKVKDPNGRAYNRTAHLEARREMMQVWADYLDKLKQ